MIGTLTWTWWWSWHTWRSRPIRCCCCRWQCTEWTIVFCVRHVLHTWSGRMCHWTRIKRRRWHYTGTWWWMRHMRSWWWCHAKVGMILKRKMKIFVEKNPVVRSCSQFTWLIGCGLAGVCGFELVGGVIGGANRNPPSRGLCGARKLPPKNGDEPPTDAGPPCVSSIAIGEGGLSSSDCERRRYTADSSTYFDRNPFSPWVG